MLSDSSGTHSRSKEAATLICFNEIDPRLGHYERPESASEIRTQSGRLSVISRAFEWNTRTKFVAAQISLVAAGLLIGNLAGGIATDFRSSAIPVEEMTYRGMTLADFSNEMGLPIDHPYLVALFEQLCMTEQT